MTSSKKDRAAMEAALEALQIIAGERQCADNLMGDKDVAREALEIIRRHNSMERIRRPFKQEPDVTKQDGVWTVVEGQKVTARFKTQDEAERMALSMPKASVWEGRYRRGMYRNGKKVKET